MIWHENFPFYHCTISIVQFINYHPLYCYFNVRNIQKAISNFLLIITYYLNSHMCSSETNNAYHSTDHQRPQLCNVVHCQWFSRHPDLPPGSESDGIDHKKCTNLFCEYILFFYSKESTATAKPVNWNVPLVKVSKPTGPPAVV